MAVSILASEEFQKGSCVTHWSCVANRLTKALCLNVPACVTASKVTAASPEMALADAAARLCRAADSMGLFGNAALMSPTWGL